MFERGFSERIFFLLLASAVAGFLAFRPIPSIFSTNDTGRYVAEFGQQCKKPVLDSGQNKISWQLFHAMLRPACWIGGKHLFLFLAAMAMPFAFLLFGVWGGEGFLLSAAALFSLVGFELGTNALRQGMGLFFLLWAVTLILHDKKLSGAAVGVFAACVHASTILYVPLLFWFALLHRKKSTTAAEVALFTLLPVMLVLTAAVAGAWAVASRVERYQAYYHVPLSAAFVMFVSLPIYYVYVVRRKTSPESVTSEETALLIYSTLLLAASLLLFPTIAYRIAFTGCVVQIFLAMVCGNASMKQGWYILGGMMLQLGIYVVFSRNPVHVLFGEGAAWTKLLR